MEPLTVTLSLTNSEMIALGRAISESQIYNESQIAALSMPHGEHREPQRSAIRTSCEGQIAACIALSYKIAQPI